MGKSTISMAMFYVANCKLLPEGKMDTAWDFCLALNHGIFPASLVWLWEAIDQYYPIFHLQYYTILYIYMPLISFNISWYFDIQYIAIYRHFNCVHHCSPFYIVLALLPMYPVIVRTWKLGQAYIMPPACTGWVAFYKAFFGIPWKKTPRDTKRF